MKINKACRQFVTKDAIANGVDLLDVVCFRDDLERERIAEIKRLLNSIKVLGPQCTAKETLMEIPNRKVLRDMIIDKVKNGWKTETEKTLNIWKNEEENPDFNALCFKYSINRKESRKQGGGIVAISDEWVQPIPEEDSRWGKLFYTKSSYRVVMAKGRMKVGRAAGYVPPPEPP